MNSLENRATERYTFFRVAKDRTFSVEKCFGFVSGKHRMICHFTLHLPPHLNANSQNGESTLANSLLLFRLLMKKACFVEKRKLFSALTNKCRPD